MANEPLPKYPRATSPKGVAFFPRLNEPDYEYKAGGAFNTKLILPLKEAQMLMDEIDALAEPIYQQALKERKPADQKKKPLVKELPYVEEYDEDGNETGNIIFRFSLNHKVSIKDKKTGEPKELVFRPKFFDANGTAMTKVPNIWAGSVLRINFEPCAFIMQPTASAGITLRIHGVQIIKLVSGGSGSNESAKDMGFGKEDGYTTDNFDNNAEGYEPTNGDAGDF